MQQTWDSEVRAMNEGEDEAAEYDRIDEEDDTNRAVFTRANNNEPLNYSTQSASLNSDQ